MRSLLRSLTARGKAFVAAGGTAALVAAVLGERDLVRIGLLGVALPLVTALLVARRPVPLQVQRQLSAHQVSVGQQVRVELDVSYGSLSPTAALGGAAPGEEGRAATTGAARRGPRGAVLLVEERLPFALGIRPRFVMDRPRTGSRHRLSYHVASDTRGRFALGPLAVRVADPFGFTDHERVLEERAILTVTPRIEPLPPSALLGAWSGSGDNRPRSFAVGSAEDVTVREYRRGDDLRRIHWRSSARSGELMVRREEQPWQSRATILLDNRAAAHPGRHTGPITSLERAVSVAASLAVHLAQREFTVRLVTSAGPERDSGWHERPGAIEVQGLLESLSVVQAHADPRLDTTWLSEESHPGLVIAVLGVTDREDRALLQRVRGVASGAVAVTVDGPEWDRRPEVAEGAAWLAAHDWRAVTLGAEEPLAQAWLRLAAQGRGRAPVASPVAGPAGPAGVVGSAS